MRSYISRKITTGKRFPRTVQMVGRLTFVFFLSQTGALRKIPPAAEGMKKGIQ